MDFTIAKEDLLAVIDKCTEAAPDPRHVTEAFRVMTVDATKSKSARFVAIGEQCSVETVAIAEIKTKGSFCVRPKHLRDIVSSMPAGRIQLSLKGSRVTVKSLVSSRKATFEHHQVDAFSFDDPGQDAPWIEVKSHELARALRIVKSAYAWDGHPDMALLIPTPRGLDVFGSNGQMIALVETNIRVEHKGNIEITGPVIESLFRMVDDDDDVRIFADERRVYLENCDTLVSGLIPADYPFRANFVHAIANLRGADRVAGPVFDPNLLLAGIKSVLSASGFANEEERKKGMVIDLSFGDTVVVELKVGDADARDEFDCIRSGALVEQRIDSGYLLKILGSMAGVQELQAFGAEACLVLQSQGLCCAVAGRYK